jgi:hypothetical protein
MCQLRLVYLSVGKEINPGKKNFLAKVWPLVRKGGVPEIVRALKNEIQEILKKC